MATDPAHANHSYNNYQPQAKPRTSSTVGSNQSRPAYAPRGYRSSDSAYDSNGPTVYQNRAYRPTEDFSSPGTPGSMSSYNSNQVLSVGRLPLNDRNHPRTESIISPSIGDSEASSYHETDMESIASRDSRSTAFSSSASMSGYSDSRYNDELYRPSNPPKPAPRKVVPRVARQMFGEAHPRLLRPEEIPAESSGDEIEDDSSVTSGPPRPHPRASLRMKRPGYIQIVEQKQIDEENRLLRSILRTPSSIVSTPASSKIVRFEVVKTQTTNARDTTDYSDIDSNPKNKSKKSDIWSHVAPVGPKRDEKKRNSGRHQRSSSGGRPRSSRDRSGSRSSQRSSGSRQAQSLDRNQQLQASLRNKSKNGGPFVRERSNSRTRSESNPSAKPDEVRLEMPKESKPRTSHPPYADQRDMKTDIDVQKYIKWGLIIGVPIVLLIIVGIVIGVLFSQR